MVLNWTGLMFMAPLYTLHDPAEHCPSQASQSGGPRAVRRFGGCPSFRAVCRGVSPSLSLSLSCRAQPPISCISPLRILFSSLPKTATPAGCCSCCTSAARVSFSYLQQSSLFYFILGVWRDSEAHVCARTWSVPRASPRLTSFWACPVVVGGGLFFSHLLVEFPWFRGVGGPSGWFGGWLWDCLGWGAIRCGVKRWDGMGWDKEVGVSWVWGCGLIDGVVWVCLSLCYPGYVGRDFISWGDWGSVLAREGFL
ncbi:hypothetical protein B0J11DRAFT_289868 [Dendryphion nanum]|uniref:Uncharacterized protein n=1 Tax=Dendryphion nanum TaxID=256645 RepID=A0A9P9IPW4_9PLEO|nr:hypothetical protein B0J11DRAFT_289868 [Dendryphion nanum]